MILSSTSDILRVVTGAAASIVAHVDWLDNVAGVVTPGRTNTAAITTATNTQILGSPAGSTQRLCRSIYITNNHASAASQCTLQHYDGSNYADIITATLLAGETLQMDESGEWDHRDSQGGSYTYAGPPSPNLGPTGTLAETMPRETCPEVNTAVGATGVLFLQAIYLKAGQLVSNISMSSATTAAGTPTNYFFALYDGARALKASSTNQTTTAWAANTYKTLAMSTPYRVPTSGIYYIGLMMTATTVVTIKGGTAKTGGTLASTAPILHGTSSTGLTTALPDPAAAITGGTASIYANVS